MSGTPGRARSIRSLLPGAADYRGVRTSWRADLLAGVTVGIVALPLALAFGVSSGVGAEAGLITAIVAGVVAAVFGGSNVQVSGPTGAMVVVLAPVVATHGVLSGPAVERLKNCGAREVVLTDTVPIPEEKRWDSLTVLSIAPLLASAIKAVFEDGSVAELFDTYPVHHGQGFLFA